MQHGRDNGDGEAVYEHVEFHPMPDVPYELTDRKLASMQKIERGLGYILDNLLDADLSLEKVAEYAGYSPRYFKNLFKSHFEMPFAQFVSKLRMRQAARDIRDEHFPVGISERYGFSTKANFSRAFRREFGLSPRQFYKGNYAVPDMPMREALFGVPISLEYTIERAFVLRGRAIPPPLGASTYLMDALALPFGNPDPQLARAGREEGADYVGVWNYHPETGLTYVFGPVEERLDSLTFWEEPSLFEDETVRVVVHGGRFAVFSYPRPRDDALIPLLQRILSRFIFKEWIPMNRKVANTMGFTFERFTPERVYIYLPIQVGMDCTSEVRAITWGVGQWARHIDDLITVDLNIDVLADLEGYSTKNYVDIFGMYYGVSPSTYIRRRRLYLVGEELREEMDEERRDEVLRRYRFASFDQYCRLRDKEFAGDVGEADLRLDTTPDLEAYYQSNKERAAFKLRRIGDLRILGRSIEESRGGHQPHDLTWRVMYWFLHDFPDFEQFEPYFSPGGEKVFIWADVPQPSDEDEGDGMGASGASGAMGARSVSKGGMGAAGERSASKNGSTAAAASGEDAGAFGSDDPDAEISRYYIANILRSDLGDDELADLERSRKEAGAHSEVIPGGCYAMFSTVDDLESYSLEDAFRLLTRCAFGGWIKENRWRVDFSRRTFVVWCDGKLYFYVPTIG